MRKINKISPDYRNMFSNISKTDYHNNNLKGNVKLIVEHEIKSSLNHFSFNFSVIDDKLFKIAEYNLSGDLIDYREIYEGNVPYMINLFYFDEKNNLIQELTLDDNNSIVETIKYEYDSNGNVIKEYQKETDKLFLATYDLNGLLCKVINKSELQGHSEKTYIIKRELGNNQLISEVIESHNNREFNVLFKYDSFGNIINIDNNNYNTKENIEYDSYNNPIKIESKDKRGLVTYKHEYEYDEQKNWIKSTFFIDGTLDRTTFREITYF
jgi:hypothetical protein